MQLLPSSTRAVGVLTLAAAAALLVPGAALAETPTPSTTTTGATVAPSPTTSDPTTTASPTTSDPTTTSPTTSPTTTAPTTTPAGTGSTASGTGTPSSSSTTTAAPRTSLAKGARKAAAPVPAGGAQGAADFLSAQLAANGDRFQFEGTTFDDLGLTLDAVLALTLAGGHGAQVDASLAYVAKFVDDYSGKSWGDLYPGSLGKTMLAVSLAGANPRAFGGANLVTQLQGLELPDGHFRNLVASGDFSSTLTQALALAGLGQSGAVPSQKSVDFLLRQQCFDGGFRFDLGGTTCTSDTDVTSFAVLALGSLCAESTAVDRARSYLQSRQAAGGGIDGGSGTGLNANSTGLGAWALSQSDSGAAVAGAQSFLSSLQYDSSFPSPLVGGLAYTETILTAKKAAGAGAKVVDQDLRSTSQGLLGLVPSRLAATVDTSSLSCVLAAQPQPSTSTSTGTRTVQRPATNTTAAPAPADPPAASATPGGLAFTGADVATTAVLGLLLLLVGVAAIVLARRKGAHA